MSVEDLKNARKHHETRHLRDGRREGARRGEYIEMVGRGGIEPPTPGFSELCGPLPTNDLHQVSQPASQSGRENASSDRPVDAPAAEPKTPAQAAIDPDVLALARRLAALTPDVRKALKGLLGDSDADNNLADKTAAP